MRNSLLPLSLSLALTLAPRLAAADEPCPAAEGGRGPVAVKASPSGWTSAAPVSKYKNPELRTAGLVLIGLSLGAGALGGVFAAIGGTHKGSDDLLGAGGAMLAGGALVLLVGTGVTIAGSVERSPDEARARRPEILVGAGSAGMRWRF